MKILINKKNKNFKYVKPKISEDAKFGAKLKFEARSKFVAMSETRPILRQDHAMF